MFTFDREQQVATIGNVKVGGQPGVNPPLIVPSLFQKGDPCVQSRGKRQFDRTIARERGLRRLEELSDTDRHCPRSSPWWPTPATR